MAFACCTQRGIQEAPVLGCVQWFSWEVLTAAAPSLTPSLTLNELLCHHFFHVHCVVYCVSHIWNPM